MQIIITSLDQHILQFDDIESVSIPTKSGIIGMLPGHVPLLSALNSGVLSIVLKNGEKQVFAISGWVVETDGNTIRILTDMAENEASDLETIRLHKQEAFKAMEEARASGDLISMERIIEIEQEYQKDTAREQLAMGNHR